MTSQLSSSAALKPARAFGSFTAMGLDTLVLMFKPPFAWQEFLAQSWFITRVSLLPAILMSVPFLVIGIFYVNILLVEIGATDLMGVAAGLGAVTQIGPVVTVLVVAGAGATAMCADLGARTIREELDAMRVLGINPVQALVVPRVLAGTFVALLLENLVALVGLVGSFFFSVFVQHGTPGAFAAGLTLIVGLPELIVGWAKAALFGLTASLIACYKGINVGGGPAGVGTAVNETVMYAFVALYAINLLLTAVGTKVNPLA